MKRRDRLSKLNGWLESVKELLKGKITSIDGKKVNKKMSVSNVSIIIYLLYIKKKVKWINTKLVW